LEENASEENGISNRLLPPTFIPPLTLFDVIAVIHAVMAQRVAEAPEFLDDVGHERILTTDGAH